MTRLEARILWRMAKLRENREDVARVNTERLANQLDAPEADVDVACSNLMRKGWLAVGKYGAQVRWRCTRYGKETATMLQEVFGR